MLEHLKSTFKKVFPSRSVNAIIAHNKCVWAAEAAERSADGPRTPILLVDIQSVPETTLAYSYFVNAFRRLQPCRVISFSRKRSVPFLATQRLYRSFGVDEHLEVKPHSDQISRGRKYWEAVQSTLKSKEDLLRLQYEGFPVGVDILESYLRELSMPALDIKDHRLQPIAVRCFAYIEFWKEYFGKHNVVGLVVSHDLYVFLNAACKVAYSHNVPVYLPNARGVGRSDGPYSLYNFFPNYPKFFRSLNSQAQAEGLAWARTRLTQRFSGRVGVDMHYSTASAYDSHVQAEPVLVKSDRFKALIATHCFFDNPHAYAQMAYPDFWDWLITIGEHTRDEMIDVYLKTHPDPLPGTQEAIERFLALYPHVRQVPYRTSHHQLIKEGIGAVLTCFGTIGHEYPALGIPVVSAAYNPHVGYEFNHHALTKEKLIEALRSLAALKVSGGRGQIEEFYFTHYKLANVDNFIFPSFEEYLSRSAAHYAGPEAAYPIFMESFTQERHKRIQHDLERYLASGMPHLFQSMNGLTP